jgi:3-dehydroquinate synthase
MDEAQFRRLMAVDKKAMDGGLRLVLLKGIGRAVVTGEFSAELLSQTLTRAA